MNNVKLGEILFGEEDAFRDAIHIAVAPVVAGENLKPGQRIGIVDGKAAECDRPIGIVDPFLRHDVAKDHKFYLLLFPNTITSLRHEWVHPSFDLLPTSDQVKKALARQFIEEAARVCCVTYDSMMSHARYFAEDGDSYFHMGENESYKDFGQWDEFWTHFETLTGIKPKERWGFFSCSC